MKLLHNPWFWCLWAGVIAIALIWSAYRLNWPGRCLWAGVIAIALIWSAYRLNWPGTGFQGKTVWDWLSLLVIPAALALVALLFNQMNTSTERQIASQRYEQDKEIAEKRYEQDQEIALDKQREDLLQAYLDRMSELLLEKGLRTSATDAEVRNVARTRTISVLRQLDAKRVGSVFAFLREAGLANTPDPIVSLKDADLSGVQWEGADLFYADLSNADLRQAILSKADLSGANLSVANLSRANLSRARLKGATISKGQLTPEQIAQAIWD